MTATYNAHEDGAYRCYTLARDGRTRQYLDCSHPTPSEAIAHDPLSAGGTAGDGRATADVTIRPGSATGSAPDLAQRIGAVPLDLALADGPRLADEASAELPLGDLTPQRRRRHPKPGCRLSESEHLLGVREGDALGMDRDVVGAAVDGHAGLETELADPRVADRATDAGPASGIAGLDVGDEFVGGGHPVLPRDVVDVRNVDDTAYVVNPLVAIPPRLRVLVACEFSGRVRDAFIAAGHDAWSCDLLPSERPGPHIIGDAVEVANRGGWDLMVAHPPCTYLAVSGARWFKDRPQEMADALAFVAALMAVPIPRIAIENPVSVISSRIRKPDQIVQPWMFGHGETKTTCLWLKGLPALEPTDIVVPEWAIRADGSVHLSAKGKRDNPTHFLTGRTTRVLTGAQAEQWERIHKEPPGPDRWKNRSRTYPGIAAAMAAQWGSLPDVPPSASSDPVPSLTGEPDGALGEASGLGGHGAPQAPVVPPATGATHHMPFVGPDSEPEPTLGLLP